MGTPEMTKVAQSGDIRIRPLLEPDLKAAEYVIRLAFGTFIGLPDPLTFMGDCHYSKTRWVADPTAVFCAEAGDELLGSVFAADWGSVGIFGPLTVHPAYWDRGIATRLLEPVMDLFAQRQITLAGLCTFPTSPKHIGLYQKFGY